MSATLHGVEAIPVAVEVSVSQGLPGMTIVGMGDTAVHEARERVRTAIRSSGYSMPIDKIVVNLAPGDLKKSGSGFDLPIAIGILVATGQLHQEIVSNTMFVGELSLKGEIREFPGQLAYAICAKKLGLSLVSATENTIEIGGLTQVYFNHLSQFLTGECANLDIATKRPNSKYMSEDVLDFCDIAGQECAKRALQIATAGSHGILLSGSPGTGKTVLASRVPSILPKLTEDEKIESAIIHSVAGEEFESILAGVRPFRKPHHSATMAGILGGGNPVRPGEVTLAHNGVLFLDELAEFKSSVLQGLRQPLESGEVIITRAQGTLRMPASFLLIAATNPCPCGNYGSSVDECKCTPLQISKYQGRVGGPLIDRFQMQIDVKKLPSSEIFNSGNGLSSAIMRDGVLVAKEFRKWREFRDDDMNCECIKYKSGILTRGNSSITTKIMAECQLSSDSQKYISSIADAENLSGRSIVGILKVARTIADMSESESVDIEHLAEAIGFRLCDTFGGV